MKQFPLAFCLILFLQPGMNAVAQDVVSQDNKPAEEPMVLKFYPLGELVNNAPAASTSFNGQMNPPANGGGGSYSGGGGGGFFSIPATPLSHAITTTQVLGGGGANSLQQPPEFQSHVISVYKSDDQHAALIDVLTENVDSASWEFNGGDATISAVNDTLLIRQTESNHKLVSVFLKQLLDTALGGQPVSLEIWWLPLNGEELRQLKTAIANDRDLAELNQACESTGGFHATARGRSRFTSNLNSVQKMPLIMGRIPIVGNGAMGEQLIVNQTEVGIAASLTPRILESWQGEGVQIQMQTTLTTVSDVSLKEASGSELDRYKLGMHTMECNTICPFDQPVIVGSLSAVGLFPEDENQRQMTVVVLVKQ